MAFARAWAQRQLERQPEQGSPQCGGYPAARYDFVTPECLQTNTAFSREDKNYCREISSVTVVPSTLTCNGLDEFGGASAPTTKLIW